MTENEFLLQDRLGVIRDTINKYGEDDRKGWYALSKKVDALDELIKDWRRYESKNT